MIRQLHHACILSGDIDRLASRLADVFGLSQPPIPRHVATDSLELRTVMVSVGNGTFLQLLEPHRGPAVAELAAGGEGTLYEVAFQVMRAADAARDLRARGIVPEDLAGSPLPEGYATAGSGNRFLYVPRASTGGPRIELIELAR